MSFEEAELCKLYHNGFNAAKISYFNQAARMSDAVAEISGNPVSMSAIQQALPASCEGLWNPRYGIRSGTPFQGHCLPKDSQALASLECALLCGGSRPEQAPALFEDVLAVNKCMAGAAGITSGGCQAMLALPNFTSCNSNAAIAAKARSLCTLSSLAGLDLLKTQTD